MPTRLDVTKAVLLRVRNQANYHDSPLRSDMEPTKHPLLMSDIQLRRLAKNLGRYVRENSPRTLAKGSVVAAKNVGALVILVVKAVLAEDIDAAAAATAISAAQGQGEQ